MRFLNTTTYVLTNDSDPEFIASPEYAILSHRWAAKETTFQDYDPADLRSLDPRTARYTTQVWKLRGACAQARIDGLRWLWVDTCCIDKASSAELSEAINSMFAYYRNAKVCYCFLSDVTASSGFQVHESLNKQRNPEYSEWFKRGWTLQELLAPRVCAFFDRDWQCIGSRTNLAAQIERITGIDADYLTGRKRIKNACIATKMSWMSKRTTTRVEDMAYSLLGIFDINLTPVYGEGEKSFLRLQRALLEQSPDESLLAWTTGKHAVPIAFGDHQCSRGDWGLLAPSPKYFRGCGRMTISNKEKKSRRAEGGLSWTQQGIRVPIPADDAWRYDKRNFFDSLLMDEDSRVFREVCFTLNCWKPDETGKLRTIHIHLHRRYAESGTWTRYRLDKVTVSDDHVPASGAGELRFKIGGGEQGTSLRAIPIVVYQPQLGHLEFGG